MTTENIGLMTYVDESGNTHILYPVTTPDAVDGLGELLTAERVGAVPVSRTINGITLDKDIEIDLESTDWIEVPLNKTYATQGSVMYKKYGKIVFFGFGFIPNTTKITNTWTSYTLATGLPVPASSGSSQTCSAHETGTRLFCNCYVEDGDLMFMAYEQLVTWGDVRGFGVYEAED